MSPVPFQSGVEKSLAVYPGRNLAYENFIQLPKDFLEQPYAKPCKNFDNVLEGDSVSTSDALLIVNSYRECKDKMDSMIEFIAGMKGVTDKIASEQRARENNDIKKANDPFLQDN